MYSSMMGKDGQTTIVDAQNTGVNGPRTEDKQDLLTAQGHDKIILKPILEYGATLMNEKIIVKKIIADTEFVVYLEELRTNLVMRQIPYDEDLTKWVKLPPHTNIVSVFDTFEYQDGGGNIYKFSLSEMTNAGNMYRYIQNLDLQLGITIPLSYMEVIYDCMIQLTLGMEYAHNNGLVHGHFGLENVMLSKDGDTTIYKINNFAPGSSLNLPLTEEANKWPFIRGRKRVKEAEKLEILMLKDIYSLGICLLELMIGRYHSKKFSISLDALPLTWAEYAESTTLIQVLVECIQLDAITQRKGKLQQIRHMLIKSHAKYFNKSYYKMGEPYIGKHSDILNKMAIAALFQDKLSEAESLWEGAIELRPNHFDTKVNYEMYRWKYGIISDDQLLSKLEQNVFKNQHKGHSLEGIINIALGEKQKGLEILEKFNNQKKEVSLINYDDPSENMRRKKAKEYAKEIFLEVNNRRDDFFQNMDFETQHEARIDHIQCTKNGKYFTTSSTDCVIIWQLEPEIKMLRRVDVNEVEDENLSDQEKEGGSDDMMSPVLSDGVKKQTLASLDNNCVQLLVYQGEMLFVKLYNIDLDAEDPKEQVRLQTEVDILMQYEDANDKKLYIGDDDIIEDMRFRNDDQEMRMYITQRGQPYYLDMTLNDMLPSFEKCERYEDKTIFKFGQRFVDYHEPVSKFLQEQDMVDSKYAFPEKDPRQICVLNRERNPENYFYIYDIFLNRFTRKISKIDVVSEAFSQSMDSENQKPKDINPEAAFQTDAFDIDPKTTILIYAVGRTVRAQSIQLPDSIKKHMAPQYKVSEHKYSPARVQEVKQHMKNKINRDLDHYYQLGDNQIHSNLDRRKQTILQLLTLKYNQMTENKRIIQGNDEFLTLSRILMKEVQPDCPITGVQSLIKLQNFDHELSVLGANKHIKMMQLVSQVPMNIMYLAIGPKIYKYDLVSKELKIEFSSFAGVHMSLFDFDDKLLVADQEQVRLWDFFDGVEAIPELVTVLETPLKVECIKVNKFAEETGERKGVYYFVVACKDEFRIYHDNLDLLLEGDIDNKMDKITDIEFGIDNKHLFIGTEKGFIYKFSLPSPEEVENEYEAKDNEVPKAKMVSRDPCKPEPKTDYDYSISILYRVPGILQEDFFAMHVRHSGLIVWNEKKDAIKRVECPEYKGEIDQIKSTADGKFILVGLPNMNMLMFYSIEKDEPGLYLIPGGKINLQYTQFETDDDLSILLANNQKVIKSNDKKVKDQIVDSLTLYAIKWIFDTSRLEIKRLQKCDDDKLGLEESDSTSGRNTSSRMGSSNRRSRKVQIKIDSEALEVPNQKKSCNIF